MNCREQDLAIVVSGHPRSNVGKVIRVTRLIATPLPWWAWEYEGHVLGQNGGRAQGVADQCLRPLRDTDGVDEMLIFAGKPVGEIA